VLADIRGRCSDGASNVSGVIDDSNFADLYGYFFRNFRNKANNTRVILYEDMLFLVGL